MRLLLLLFVASLIVTACQSATQADARIWGSVIARADRGSHRVY